MPRVVVLASTRARWLRADGPVRAAVLAPRPGVEVVETPSPEALERAARDIARRPPDVVVLAGGDGSHGRMLGALVTACDGTELPPIALAPAGTTCTVARNWSSRSGGIVTAGAASAARTCARLIDAVARGGAATIARPTLHVASDVVTRVAFIVGAGLVARFFDVYEARGAGGYRTAAAITARVFAGSFAGTAFARAVLDPVPCSLEVDGVRAPFDAVSLLVASVVRDLGLSLRLTYRAGEDASRFHVVATPLGPRALGPQMPRVLAARPLRGERVDALASRVRLAFPRGTGAFVVDGDLVRSDAVAIEAGPVVRVVRLDA